MSALATGPTTRTPYSHGATARALPAEPAPRQQGPASAPGRPTPPALRVVAPVAPARRVAPRAPFVLLVTALLIGGLVTLLLLNTALAEDAFTLHDLQRQQAVTADREASLHRELDRMAAPGELDRRARELGMVPAGDPTFLREPDGTLVPPQPPGTVVPLPGPDGLAVTATGSDAPGAVAGGGPAAP